MVPSISKAIAILRLISTKGGMGVNAVARALNLSPSSCFNILKTLAAEDFLRFDPATKVYSIGDGLAELVRVHGHDGDWRNLLHADLRQLADSTGRSSGFWRYSGNRSTLVDVIESPLETRVHLTTGQRLPAHLGAIGRCLLALEAPDARRVEEIIAELRWQAPPDPETYFKELLEVRERGWAMDDGHYLRGVVTIAAAIVGPNAVPTYCITSTGFSGQHSPEKLEEIGTRLASIARKAAARAYALPAQSAPTT
ncbi:IclR family transcriptional regulator [Novosphingobium pentaromativorans]|uniref:IclR family transcriptional regulator n=1 Tax=Novosphingobium pentaromativorans US6-1 TaxID=1088721 RepID=G6ED67_9SPHN|nr:IclR family transcriptional regulator [Novosphingobium pentaromativorans]AIT79839.1 hypothetical protein JI59_08655 [Novosphingobium pentaromativorans US6-1]EHJ60779.1 hypothetical protein NSU_2288 [Novosphingobium pentaromativorans US6-1]